MVRTFYHKQHFYSLHFDPYNPVRWAGGFIAYLCGCFQSVSANNWAITFWIYIVCSVSFIKGPHSNMNKGIRRLFRRLLLLQVDGDSRKATPALKFLLERENPCSYLCWFSGKDLDVKSQRFCVNFQIQHLLFVWPYLFRHEFPTSKVGIIRPNMDCALGTRPWTIVLILLFNLFIMTTLWSGYLL